VTAEPDSRAKVFARAIKILSARPRSEQQLRERLLASPGAQAETVEACISRLKKLGFLDDDKFAESYASHRVSVKPMGRARIARELAEKRVERSQIGRALESVFETTNEEELIDRAVAKRIRTHGVPADQRGARTMFQHLARLGFQYELIIRKIQALKRADQGEDSPN
jgi:regulatory protein